MRHRRSRLSNARAGVLALVVIALGTYFAFAQGTPFDEKFEVRAVVAGAPEVHSRTPVRVAGVEVGKVAEVDRGPGSAVTITMALERNALPVHRDATLKVRPRIFLEGNFFLDLSPGSPSAPDLEDGDTIPLAQTSAPVQLDQVLQTLRSSTREDLRRVVRELAKALDKGGAESLDRSFPWWAPAFRALAQTSEAFRGEREHDLSELIDAGGRTAEALSRGERLPDLVTGLNRSTRALASRRVQLEASVVELDAMLAEAHPALAAIDRMLPSARVFLSELRPGLRAAPATLRLGLPLLDQARALLRPRELPALLRQARPAIRSLARLEPRLADLLALVTPVTECLRRNAVPTLKKSVEDPPLTTGEPVYRELLQALVGQAGASQNFDGNGPSVRYHAGFGEQLVTTGQVSSIQEPLKALTSERILGSRPRYTGRRPPFRPDVRCTTQRPPDLRAETGPAPQQTRAPGVKRPPLRKELRR